MDSCLDLLNFFQIYLASLICLFLIYYLINTKLNFLYIFLFNRSATIILQVSGRADTFGLFFPNLIGRSIAFEKFGQRYSRTFLFSPFAIGFMLLFIFLTLLLINGLLFNLPQYFVLCTDILLVGRTS